MARQNTIAFVDNLVHEILKSYDTLREDFPGTYLFTHEKELFELMEKQKVDLVLLNLDLSPNDGIHLMKEIVSRQKPEPPLVVIYSPKQDDFVQELALNSGADSFIGFYRRAAVLRLFVKNMLSRRKPHPRQRGRQVEIDLDSFLVYMNGKPVQLPRKEFMLFQLLYNNSHRFYSKADIATEIWHDEKVAQKRTIDVHIYNIRQFFGKRIIQSQKGKGYRINKKLIAEG